MSHKIQMVIIGSKAVHTRQNLNEHSVMKERDSSIPECDQGYFYIAPCKAKGWFLKQPHASQLSKKSSPKQTWQGFPLWFELDQYLYRLHQQLCSLETSQICKFMFHLQMSLVPPPIQTDSSLSWFTEENYWSRFEMSHVTHFAALAGCLRGS